MVFRKPYALLIKYFMLIHILLSALMIYLIVKSNVLVGFFNDFISSGYVANEVNFAGKYVNFFMYLAVFLVLIVCIVVYLLMKQKEKPTKLYSYTILYYIVLIIMYSVLHGALTTFETQLIDASTARIYRDIAVIIMLPQFVYTILFVIRSIGFDIKKFNFSKDLQELKIEVGDNEEFEVAVGGDVYKLKRSFRRNFREFKYYLLENKFILMCIALIFISIIGTGIYLNIMVYNRNYQVDQSFISNNMKIKIGNSYLTNLSYNGDYLSKTYLVVEVEFENLLNVSRSLELENYRLIVENKILIPTTKRNEHFIDLGIPYAKEKLKVGSVNNRLLIFELEEADLKDKYTLRVLNSINAKAGEIQARYSEAIIKPKVLDNINIKTQVELNEELTFDSNILGSSSAKINSYSITRYYKYNYENCVKSICRASTAAVFPESNEYDKTLLVIDGSIIFDPNSLLYSRIKNLSNMYTMFIKIKYNKKNNTKIIATKNVTPSNLTDKIILLVYNGVENADSISLVFSIRDKEYLIKLK